MEIRFFVEMDVRGQGVYKKNVLVKKKKLLFQQKMLETFSGVHAWL